MVGENEKDKEKVVARTGLEILRPVLSQAKDDLVRRSDDVAALLSTGKDVSDAMELELQAIQRLRRVASLVDRLDGKDDVMLGLKTELEALGVKKAPGKTNADA